MAPPTHCRRCNLTFSTWNDYHIHKTVSRHHIYCVICSHDFKSTDAYKRHHDQEHSAEQHLPCPGCNRVFTRIGGLMNHIELTECLALDKYKDRKADKSEKTGGLARIQAHAESWTHPENAHMRTLPVEPTLDTQDQSDGLSTTTQVEALYSMSPQMPRVQLSGVDSQASNTFLIDLSTSVDNTVNAKARDKSSLVEDEEDLIDLEIAAIPGKLAVTTSSHSELNTSIHAPTINYKNTEDFPALGATLKQEIKTSDDYFIIDKNPWVAKKQSDTASSAHPLVDLQKDILGRKRTPDLGTIKQELLHLGRQGSAWSLPKNLFPKAPPAVAPPVSLIESIKTGPPGKGAENAVDPESKKFPPHHPKAPGFCASDYLNTFTKKFKCPHSGCSKSFGSANGFVQHLTSAVHVAEAQKLQCPNCFRYYHSATALTQHAEAQGIRCKIRELVEYGTYVEDFTASTAGIDGRHADDTVRYVITDEAKKQVNAAAQRVINANAAIHEAKAQRQEDFWKSHEPTW